MSNSQDERRSEILPTDPFDLALSKLTGHPNGAHTQPAVVQAMDFYGNVSSFMVQTVKWDEGSSVFVTQVNATGSLRYVLPPAVMRTITRQQDAVSLMVRRRHGKRLAEQARAEGRTPTFTPEMREKARLTRAKKTAAKKARRAKKARG